MSRYKKIKTEENKDFHSKKERVQTSRNVEYSENKMEKYNQMKEKPFLKRRNSKSANNHS